MKNKKTNLKHTLKNNIFIIKTIWKVAPQRIVFSFLLQLVDKAWDVWYYIGMTLTCRVGCHAHFYYNGLVMDRRLMLELRVRTINSRPPTHYNDSLKQVEIADATFV